MGYESDRVKFRECKSCGKEEFRNAKTLQSHSIYCKRLMELGLISPDQVEGVGDLRPQVPILNLD